jgi:hypothetical protein
MHDDLDRAVGALLHTARDLLLAEADKTRGPHKRQLKNIEAAVSDALGVYSRYGHTPDEWCTVTERLRAG